MPITPFLLSSNSLPKPSAWTECQLSSIESQCLSEGSLWTRPSAKHIKFISPLIIHGIGIITLIMDWVSETCSQAACLRFHRCRVADLRSEHRSSLSPGLHHLTTQLPHSWTNRKSCSSATVYLTQSHSSPLNSQASSQPVSLHLALKIH